MCLEIIYLKYIYKKNLALNNLQWLICHKIQSNHQTKILTILSKVNEQLLRKEILQTYVLKKNGANIKSLMIIKEIF